MAGKTAYKNDWQKQNVDRVNLTMPKGRKADIKAHADALGESVNGFIGRAIQEAMERDTGAAGGPQEAGVVSLPSETLETAQRAAEAAGEGVQQFVVRAVETQAQRDKVARKMEGVHGDL